MSIWESIVVALENLRMNKLRSFLTVIGIVVGVAAVVTVVSIGEAGKSSVISEISNYGEGFFVVYPNYMESQAQQDVSITMRDLDEVRKIDGIVAATGIISLTMSSKAGTEDIQFSISAGTADLARLENVKMESGRFFSTNEDRSRQKVAVVDQAYAEKHHGSAEAAVNRRMVLDGKQYRIIGVYKKESSLFDSFGGQRFSAYIPIASLPVTSSQVRVDMIEASAATGDEEQLAAIISEVKKLLAKRHSVSERSYLSQTGAEAEQQIGSVFNILQTIIGSIAGISLLVGGIGVMNIMLVSVTERTREIGIRKAIGATPGIIMGQFMIEAVILSFLGGMIGALLGLGCSFIFSMFTGWPFLVSWGAMVLAFGFSAAVGIFFGLYPANKAARLQPIESLRYE